MKSMIRRLFCFSLSVFCSLGGIADNMNTHDVDIIPNDIIRFILSSNRALDRELREYRSSPAISLLDEDAISVLDRAIDFMSQHGDISQSPNALSTYLNEFSEFTQSLMPSQTIIDYPQWCNAPPCDLERGDIVLARTSEPWSAYLANASLRDKRFSHISIVLDGGPTPSLIEINNDVDTSQSKFFRCGWDNVVGNAIDCAVFRLDANSSIRSRIGDEAEKRIGRPYDPAFDLKTKDRLYCTEMVRDCVNEAAGREVIGTSRKGDFEYVAVDDCYSSEMTKVWDCRDVKPVAEIPLRKQGPRPVVVDAASTTNAPVRRTIRFIPKNRGGR